MHDRLLKRTIIRHAPPHRAGTTTVVISATTTAALVPLLSPDPDPASPETPSADIQCESLWTKMRNGFRRERAAHNSELRVKRQGS